MCQEEDHFPEAVKLKWHQCGVFMKGGHLDPHLERQPCDSLTGLSCPVWDISSRRSRELAHPPASLTGLFCFSIHSCLRPVPTDSFSNQANLLQHLQWSTLPCSFPLSPLPVVLTPSPTPTDLRKASIRAEISLTTAPHLQALPELAVPLKTNHLWHLDLACLPILTACLSIQPLLQWLPQPIPLHGEAAGVWLFSRAHTTLLPPFPLLPSSACRQMCWTGTCATLTTTSERLLTPFTCANCSQCLRCYRKLNGVANSETSLRLGVSTPWFMPQPLPYYCSLWSCRNKLTVCMLCLLEVRKDTPFLFWPP